MQQIYCQHCQMKIEANSKMCPFCARPIELSKSRRVEGSNDLLATGLGLQKLDAFSWTELFRDVFASRKSEDIETQMSFGFPDSTPRLNNSMLALPAPWLFARMLFWSVALFIAFLIAFDQYKSINIVPGLILIGTFAIPSTVLMLFFELNTTRNISFIKILQIFLTSGVLSVILAIIWSELAVRYKAYYDVVQGPIEELAKLFTIIFVMRSLTFERYRFSINGLLLGAAVGAGFAAFESAGYALRVGLNLNPSAMIFNIVIRGVLSPFSHIVWSAIAVCAFWRTRQYHKNNFDTLFDLRFLIIFSLPCLLHYFWNTDYQLPYLGKYLIIGMIGWAIVFRLYQDGLKQIEAALVIIDSGPVRNVPLRAAGFSSEGWLISGIMPDGKFIKFNLPAADGKLVIGRDKLADIVIPDTSISREHASIQINRGRIWISDMNSTNGSTVNGRSLAADPIELRVSDTIKLGSIQLSISAK
jgi:protease PrsW